jgi:predicted nuclease of predicted toxin-antitoxin system
MIFAFARRHEAILVTIDRTDFVSLAAYVSDHPGVIILPSVVGKELARLFKRVLPVAKNVFQDSRSMFVQIDANGRVTSFQLPVG